MMKRYQTDFGSTLKQCLLELYTFSQIDSVKKLLEIYDRLDISKIMFKYLEIMDLNNRELKNKDDVLFLQPIVFFPGVDMSIIWPSLNDEQKNTIWTYLNLLYSTGQVIIQDNSQLDDLSIPSSLSDIYSSSYDNKYLTKTKNDEEDGKKKQDFEHENVIQMEKSVSSSHNKKKSKNESDDEKCFILNNKNKTHNENNVYDIIEKLNKLDNLDLGSKHKNRDKKTEKTSKKHVDNGCENSDGDSYLGFDPFVGVGNDENFTVNDIIYNENCEHEDEKKSNNFSFETIGKMLNVDDVVKQIENIAPNDIDETSDKIKSVLKNQFDDKSETGSIINDIIEDVTHEFKNGFSNMDGNGNTISSMDKIMNMSTKIAEKIIPKITSSNIQLEDMLQSAMNLHQKCGEGINNKDLNNHMDLLNNLFKQMCPTNENTKKQNKTLCHDENHDNIDSTCNKKQNKHNKHKSHKDY